MGDIRGFLKVKRQVFAYRPVCERVKDYSEVAVLGSEVHSKEQASRCMDCGTPFCHWGCPIGNYIPEWNDAVFRSQWEKAFSLLDATNNLPEITGRLCPAPCEYACVLGINDDPVTIRENELAIIEYAFRHGLVSPSPPKKRTGKKTAVIGSGPAGLACTAQLNKAGHLVTVFERSDKVGGIMRYGIPDFKLEKWILDRRVKIWEKEGIVFKTGVDVGAGLVPALRKEFDAICLAGGCRVPRDLKIEGRGLNGIHFAMDYLIEANKVVSSGRGGPCARPAIKGAHEGRPYIDASGKHVVVIGGGDTGADCVGVANRQGAKCVVQIELLPKPQECRTQDYPWPKYPLLLKTSTSHEESGERKWAILTKRFIGEPRPCQQGRGRQGDVKRLSCVQVEFEKDAKGCPVMKEIHGSEFEIEADLVILALGFIHPEKKGLIEQLGVALDARGNVKTDENYRTSIKNVFAAGDMRRGQSLIVHAISEGRRAACAIDKHLTGYSKLPVI